MKKISIISPVYNSEKTIRRMIESIIRQSYSEIELILIDDGSIDTSLSICKEYEKGDKRIKVIHQENQGVSKARNMGIAFASGEYISFIDSDDWIDVDFYEHMVNISLKYNADIVICDIVYEFPNKQIKSYSHINTVLKLDSKTAIEYMFQDSSYGGFVWNKLYKKDFFKHRKFDEKISMCEDLLLNLDLFSVAKCIVFTSEKKYHYFQSGKSITTAGFTYEKFTGIRALQLSKQKIEKKFPELLLYIEKKLYLMKVSLYLDSVFSLKEKDVKCVLLREEIIKGLMKGIVKFKFNIKELLKGLMCLLPRFLIKGILVFKYKIKWREF